MPNFDAGCYFLTAAVPIRIGEVIEHDGFKSSAVHMVRDALDTLPTALQSPASVKLGLNSPFSRNSRTHFCRFVVLDQPYFNGRVDQDSLVTLIAGTNLLQPQPVDELSCPYLLVLIDFDAPAPAGEPRAYLMEIWQQMQVELTAVFQYCYGFDAVRDAAGFAEYVIACQIETTMPFHDYWVAPPAIPDRTKLLAAVPLVLALVPLVLALLSGWGWGTGLALALAGLIAGVAFDYGYVLWNGQQPFPRNPDATLPHVLKALYLQQAFTRLVIAQQGNDAATQGAALRHFLDKVCPADLAAPTQAPGVIRSPLSEMPS